MRRCEACDEPLRLRANESGADFRRRRFCNRSCAHSMPRNIQRAGRCSCGLLSAEDPCAVCRMGPVEIWDLELWGRLIRCALNKSRRAPLGQEEARTWLDDLMDRMVTS